MRRHIYYTLQSLLHKQGSNAIKIVSLALGLLYLHGLHSS